MKKYGLIGYPLTHSFSPKYFAEKVRDEKINAEYKAYSLPEVEAFLDLFEQGLSGLNVTIPYKEKVKPFLDKLSAEATAIGAVNTIKKEGDLLVGYNTDVYGFESSLVHCEGYKCLANRGALVLGTGGASKAIKYVLERLDFDVKLVSRSCGDLIYDQVDKAIIEANSLIINTTPLGMYPLLDNYPDLPYQYMGEKHLSYDLVYNPDKTVFLIKSEAYGAYTKNGAEMLVLQADKSWEIWNENL